MNTGSKILDSNAKNAYVVQAADYVANALYSKYEYGEHMYSNIFDGKLRTVEHFPYKKFGK